MRDNINHEYDYAESVSGPIPDYLLEVERQTYLRTMAPQMLSGRLQGRLLAMFSQLLRPRQILEIGTFTGYSALCLAEGLAEGGELHTIEGNPETALLATQHFEASPFSLQLHLHQGQAMDILPSLTQSWNLVFLDGDKQAYPDYLPIIADNMAPGGLLLADNVLWDGKVGTGKQDKDVNALHQYNTLLAKRTDFEVVLLPLRDGLSVARKKHS